MRKNQTRFLYYIASKNLVIFIIYVTDTIYVAKAFAINHYYLLVDACFVLNISFKCKTYISP